MKNNRMLTIVSIFIITSIVVSTLVYKESLNKVTIIEDSYAYVNKEVVLNNYLEEIKNNLKELDSSFNINDYKVSYDEVSEDNHNALIYLTYYIDDLIETNKIYIVEIKNNKIENIISKVNIINTESEKDLLKRVKLFEETKKEELILKDNSLLFKTNNILNRDKTINERKLINGVNSVKEKYEYNYTSNILLYSLTIYANDTKEVKIKID